MVIIRIKNHKKMQINRIINFLLVLTLTLIGACSPIVESDELVNVTDIEGVELRATQSTAGGNLITLELITPGITGHWDYNLGKAFTDKVQFVYPIPGSATFTFNGTLGAEFFSKSVDVQIDVLDNPLDDDWYSLVSQDTSGGKTWVFSDNAPWYMANPGDYSGLWWDAWTCCLADPNGQMKFDLNGGANYSYMSDAGATPETGTFNLDVTNQTLTVSGAPILGGQDGSRLPADGVFQIISLTETEMILFTPETVAGDSGWTWQFKAQ